jgi:hypothetical protein
LVSGKVEAMGGGKPRPVMMGVSLGCVDGRNAETVHDVASKKMEMVWNDFILWKEVAEHVSMGATAAQS